ncbi:DNA repair protein RadA [Candidatus Peregrinibacteria bacterium]|nr:DNA repair protein RadA [Candidatus Peregrinibacteria bacterium]
MKLKQIYFCTKCNAESSKWSGQCYKCNSWNTLVEDVVNVGKQSSGGNLSKTRIKPIISLSDIEFTEKRLKTEVGEFDRVLGGGFMEDSVVLLVGDPGIGKSTLTIQICNQMAKSRSVLYFSGEESIQQITSRARRLNLQNPISIANINNLESILTTIESEKPGFVVVDSVQVMASDEIPGQAGSVSQVRYVTEMLMQTAKSKKIPILLIGHVTKEGQLAGPQVLTHLVDTVLYLEGDNHHQFRLLRTTKNRFGAIDEVGVFSMEEKGLTEVKNPSALFLDGRAENPIGSVIVPILEGTRTFLVEVQALTSYTQFGYPKRTSSGFDTRRLDIIIAVLTRYAGIKLDSSDVYVNVVGGLKLSEPAADLAIAMAIASSKLQKPLPPEMVIMGEVGLSGEVRNVSQMKQRLKETEKLGFKHVLSSEKVKTVGEAVKKYFG